MSASVARIGEALHAGPRLAWPIALAGLVAVAAVAALATRQGLLPIALALAALAVLTLVGFRWPLLPLVMFAALIPLEEVVVIGGFGTASKVVGVLFAFTYGAPRLRRLTFKAMPAAAWAYIAWASASLVWAVQPDVAMAVLPTLLQLFLVAVLVADFVVQRPAIVRPVLWAYSIAAAATALVGIQSYVAHAHLVGGSRATAIQGQDPAQFAAVLVPAAIFGLYAVLNGDHRLPAGVVAFLATAGIIVSGTRGVWVGYAIALIFFILPQLSLRRRAVAVAMILVLLVGAYQIPGVANLVAERSGNAVSSGGAGRTDIWTVGLTIFGTGPPLSGVGYGNFPVAYTLSAVVASGVTKSVNLVEGSAPHNLVVGTLVELGAIGLLLLALFVLPLLLRRGWGPHAAIVQAALVSLCVAALFLDVFANRKQVWLLIGIAAGLAFLRRRHVEPMEGEVAGQAADASTPDTPERAPGANVVRPTSDGSRLHASRSARGG